MPKRLSYPSDMKEFLADYGYLIRKWNVPALAKALGVTRQAIDNYINKGNKEGKLPDEHA